MNRLASALLLLALVVLAPYADARPNPNDLAYRYERFTENAGRSAIPQPREVFAEALPFERETDLMPDLPSSGIVTWADAHKFLGGDAITVEGAIVDTYETNGPVIRLQFARYRDNPRAFYIALFQDAWKDSSISNPTRHFSGKTLRVTGPVTEHRGQPNIEVRSLQQIEIVGRR